MHENRKLTVKIRRIIQIQNLKPTEANIQTKYTKNIGLS